MKAFIYPGQGAQRVGMGTQAMEAFDEARAVFEKASELAGYDMAELCAEGPIDKLSRTLYTQPAIFTVEAAITEALYANGFKPDVVAGHSLGEYGAWYAAGVFSFEDGFKLVSERGRLMDNADPDGNGAMSAIIGMSRDDVSDVCEQVDGTVVVANCNSPKQQVLSGEKDAVAKAGELLSEKGARRVVPLKVSGAFHSPLMESAREAFQAAVQGITINDAAIPVYANVTAAKVTSASEIAALMVQQITSSVRWTETVQTMVAEGVDAAYEIGPGTVLAGLVARTDKGLGVVSVSDDAAVRELI